MAAFVDTNILIYAFADSSSGSVDKVAIARSLLTSLFAQNELIVSAQVLGEFYVNAVRKHSPPLTIDRIEQRVRKLCKKTVIAVDETLVLLALQRVEQSRISYWGALIVEAAIRSGATILYTEDLHHGACYGSLEVRNPFLS